MDKSEIRIFVVDDDPTLSKALAEAVRRSGYTAVTCTSPTEALNQFKIQGAHLFIIDCLLPKMTGVELAIKLKQEGAEKIPLILTSGVFRDKTFAKDAQKKTGAKHFLNKPFSVDDMLKIINEQFKDVVEEAISPLENFLIHVYSPGEKITQINKIEELDGLDIPWLAFMLMNPSTSGYLRLGHPQSPGSIAFSEGKIVQVEMKNPESVFGNLLIENGFLTTEQLDEALKVKSDKKLGEKLVALNYLSPHAIDLTNSEQMAIRLSKLISNDTYAVSFEAKEVSSNSSFLDQEGMAPFLVAWIHSKINLQWLKQRYLKWTESPCLKTNSALKLHRIWTFPPLKTRPALIAEFEKGQSLDQVLLKAQYPEESIYQVFHLLVLIEHIKLQREIRRMEDYGSQVARLKKIWADMQSQDYFGILGVARNAKASDIKKTYHDLAKIFHPDKIEKTAPQELKHLAQNVFGQMSKAYEVLSSEEKKAQHLKEIEMGRAEKVLQAEALMEEGKAFLVSGQATKALDRFKDAQKLKTPSSELLVNLAWALLNCSEMQNNETYKAEAEDILNKIPPEDRHNASYYFVKGYFQKNNGEIVAARKNVQHAIALKPKFIEAERLLRIIDSSQKNSKPKDLLHGDLKDVVGSLFKKG